jgi:hypothetical protein
MFFPSGAITGLINHSKEPNAKMAWSNHPNNHKHWFDMDPDTLIAEGNQHLGLLMEIVSIKDIKEGEEVFIDYGEDWQEAWDKHVADWEESVTEGDLPSPWPMRALDLMQAYKDKAFPTVINDNILLKAFLMVKKPEDERPVNDKGEKVRIWTETKSTLTSENLFDISILETIEDEAEGWWYTIAWEGKEEMTVVKKVPHRAIVLMDKPGTSDQHFEESFRHYIAIPDDVFPQGPWRNVED